MGNEPDGFRPCPMCLRSEKRMPDVPHVAIPVTPSLDPLVMLTDDAAIAAWQNEGLPADRMSTENATILTNCERWPLMVDPQLQGIKWIKAKYGEHLQVTRIGQKGYLDMIEKALAAGEVVLIENLEESVDPVLGPLLGRETIKKGRSSSRKQELGVGNAGSGKLESATLPFATGNDIIMSPA
ncbi:UNVERIFIED_CONTAM: Dynein heavy chain 9, axonemal [Gekko kuhli]